MLFLKHGPLSMMRAALCLVIVAAVGTGCRDSGPRSASAPVIEPTEVVASGMYRDTTWKLLINDDASGGFCGRLEWLDRSGSEVSLHRTVCAQKPTVTFAAGDAMTAVALRQPDDGEAGVIAVLVASELDEATLSFSDGTSEVVRPADGHLVRFFENKELADVMGRGPDGSYANCRPQRVPAGELELSCYRHGRDADGHP